jgi:hypothetical protein
MCVTPKKHLLICKFGRKLLLAPVKDKQKEYERQILVQYGKMVIGVVSETRTYYLQNW